MTVYIKRELFMDGLVEVVLSPSGMEVVMTNEEWAVIAALPTHDEQEAAVIEFLNKHAQSAEEKAEKFADIDEYNKQNVGGDGDREQAAAEGVTLT